jgi:hypothetical protein
MPDNRERLVELAECKCPERGRDLICYGIHVCRDGKRVAPEDFYVEPPEQQTNSRA